MASKHGTLLAGDRVPQFDGAIDTPGGEAAAIRCICNREHTGTVAPQHGPFLAFAQVPQLHLAGFVRIPDAAASDRQCLAIRCKGNAAHRMCELA